MKKLLFLFVFISLNTFAQRNLNLGVGEHKTIEGGVYNITLNKDVILTIKGYTSIQNINNFQNATIIIDKDAVVNISGSVNQNGNSNLFVYGKLSSASLEIQNGTNALNVQGEYTVYGDAQLSDGTSEINVCGKVIVSNYTNFHSQNRERAVVLCDCAQWITHGLNSNRKNVVTGFGSVHYKTGNINAIISESNTVYINRDCDPLPVEIVSFDVKFNENNERQYNLKLSEDSTPKVFIIQTSDDGKNWKEVVRREVFMEQGKSVGNNFSGIIK